MATLHLMVGLPCSGKSTLTRTLEQEHSALRLTPDVVSSTLDRLDWNAELVRGDLGTAVVQLKRDAELGLIDEYEFVVQPTLAGQGPTLFAGLSKHIDLKLVSRLEFGSGAVAMRYEPRR